MKTLPIVLWAGPPPNKKIEGPNFEVVHFSDRGTALAQVQTLQPSIVVSAFPHLADAVEFLQEVFLKSPLSIRFLKVVNLTESALRNGFNQAQVMAVFEDQDSLERYTSLFYRAIGESTSLETEKRLLGESKRQLREFESLNQSLENIVEERTKHIEASRIDEEAKLNKSRSFVRFIKDMSMALSFEEYLLVLRRELRKFSGLAEPYLIYRLSDLGTSIIHVNQGQSGQLLLAKDVVLSENTQVGFFGLERSLANHFGRPFMRTLSVPLDIQLTRSFDGPTAMAILGVELSLQEKDAAALLNSIAEKTQILNISADRLLLENEYLRSSYRWEKTFDGLRDPIAIVDIDFQILRANKKFFNLAGRKKCYEAFASRDLPCVGCPLEKKGNDSTDAFQVAVSGRTFEVHSYPINLGGGNQPTNFVNQYVDVTAKRELYLRMLQSEKIGAIGLLAGNIAHELNNPLTGLRSLAQVLSREVEDGSPQLADLLEIEKAAARSQQIIRNLLEFSTGESTGSLLGSSPEKKLISMDEIVHRTLPLLKTAIRSYRYNLDLATASILISVEPHMIQQVVFNLINNACQAMQDAGLEKGTLSVETRHIQSARTVQLIIQDTGPGIPKELQEKIFEPFFTTKKEGKGTGLGLSLARQIIEGHGGTIRCEAPAEGGTRFIVTLPIGQSE